MMTRRASNPQKTRAAYPESCASDTTGEECREGTALPRFSGKTTVKSEGGGSSCELFFHAV